MFSNVDLHLYERSMFSHRFYVYDCDGAPVDLTGYSARLELRRGYAPSPEDPLVDDYIPLYVSTSGGQLTVNAAGYVDLTWSGAVTEEIGDTYGPVLRYDLFVHPSGSPNDAVVVAYGYVVTKKNVTIPQEEFPAP